MLQWFPLCISMGYNAVIDNAANWVSSQGRMKYINPIYTALIKSGQRQKAFELFSKNINFYHPIATSKLKKMLLQDVSP
jgi:leukotriene-A4 hydrolase